MRELLILRHGKSAWDTLASTDHERPLKKRGRRDAPRMGAWIAEQGLEPDHVIASSAERARETVELALEAMGLDPALAVVTDDLYHASLGGLLTALVACPGDARRVLVVGHNPDLEELVLHLAADAVPVGGNGKILPTAALAWFRLPDDWSRLDRGSGELVALVRPRELP